MSISIKSTPFGNIYSTPTPCDWNLNAGSKPMPVLTTQRPPRPEPKKIITRQPPGGASKFYTANHVICCKPQRRYNFFIIFTADESSNNGYYPAIMPQSSPTAVQTQLLSIGAIQCINPNISTSFDNNLHTLLQIQSHFPKGSHCKRIFVYAPNAHESCPYTKLPHIVQQYHESPTMRSNIIAHPDPIDTLTITSNGLLIIN